MFSQMLKRSFAAPLNKGGVRAGATTSFAATDLEDVVLPSVQASFASVRHEDTQGRLLTVFLSTEKDPTLKESFQNRMTAWRQGSPIIHCETYFPATRDSFVVTRELAAQWVRNRAMQRDWIVLSHDVTPQQLSRARELFCEHEGRVFDSCGWACGFFCMSPAFVSDGATMCSRVVAEVYSHPDVAILRDDEIDSRVATPAQLYEILKPPRSRTWILPTKTDRFIEQGASLGI